MATPPSVIKIPLPLDSLHVFLTSSRRAPRQLLPPFPPSDSLILPASLCRVPLPHLHDTHMGLSVTPDVLWSHPPLLSSHTLAFLSIFSLVKLLMHKGISPSLKSQAAPGPCAKSPKTAPSHSSPSDSPAEVPGGPKIQWLHCT